MGRFSTTVHIRNNADREGFIGSFCEVMKKRGFVPCGEDEAAAAYLLAFGGEWVTLALDEYSENPQKAYDDARDISAEIKSSGFSVEIVDSDFALLKLFGENKDEVIVGDGEGYGIEDAPKGDRKCWEPLLAEGGTWEQLSEIREKREVFVEDALWNAAPVLGITPEYMTADHRELSENSGEDENIRGFFFKKADEKKKSMTLNAAFIKVFGEGLEPLGFKRLKNIKNKYPYFVRVIGDEILNIISYRQTTSPKLKYKCIEILGGVATLYRRKIDFTVEPEDILTDIFHLHRYAVESGKIDLSVKQPQPGYLCNANDSEEMLRELEKALNDTTSLFPEFIDKVTDLDACVEYFYNTNSDINLCPFDEFVTARHTSLSEGLILIKAQYRDDGAEKLKKASIKNCPYGNKPEDLERFRKHREDHRAEQYAYRLEMLDDPELNKRVMEELERVKKANTEKLRSYGLDL